MVKALIIILALATTAKADVLVFVADWCPYCHNVKKFAEKYKDDFKIKIINADQRRDLVRQYHVTALPTVILTRGNSEINRRTGAMSEEQFVIFCRQAFCQEQFTGLIYFYHPNKEVDQTVSLIIRRAKRFNRYGYQRVNVLTEPELVKKWHVTKVPTLIIVERGREIARFTGADTL